MKTKSKSREQRQREDRIVKQRQRWTKKQQSRSSAVLHNIDPEDTGQVNHSENGPANSANQICCGQQTVSQGTTSSQFEQMYTLHNFDAASVLQGELEVAALDQFSLLLNLIPPSFLYGATLRGQDLGVHKIESHITAVQIHIIPGHYIVSCQRQGIVTVYDSLPSDTRVQQILPQLQTLYKTLENHTNPLPHIRYVVSQLQGCSVDCGVFAAANAYMLINGKYPDKTVLEQNKLRQHMYSCLLNKQVIDVKDGLTNGVLGTVTAIVQGTSPLGQPEGIFVLFDDPRVGTASRKTSATPRGINPNSTFIKPQTQPIQSKPYQVTRHQFPLKLSWAVTIHKVQGLTTDTAVVSLKNIFQPGMAYVALSRLTSLNGLFLIKEDYDPKAIYSNIRIHTSLAAMPQADILPCWNQFVPPSPADYSTRFLLVSHNTDGLLPNMADFRANNFIHKAHVVALQETWLTQKQNLTNPIPTHAVLLSNRENQYSRFENLPQSVKENGKGGVLLFLQNKLSYTALDTSTVPKECIAVEIESPSVTVFNVYRPPKLPLQHFTKYLQLLLSRAKTHSIIVVGDFNVDLLKGQKLSCLSNYDQLITDYTTRGCTLLDHIYTKGVQCNRSGVVQTHYSYHNMTYLII